MRLTVRRPRRGWRGLLLAGCAVLACGSARPADAPPEGLGPLPVARAPSAAVQADPVACPPEPAPLTPDQTRAATRAAIDSGFLWRATRDGHASYLYGTMHIAQPAWMFPGPKVLAAIRASDVVVLELDPTDPAIAARLQRVITRPPRQPPLPAGLEARLRRQIAAACLDAGALAAMRPEMQAVTVQMMAGRRLGLHPAFGIDIFLAGLAPVLGKPLRSLETPEAQAALLISDDPAETARTVGDMLDDLERGDGPGLVERLARDWREGRLDDLADYARWCDCVDTPARRADFARLVDARNPPMADQVASWHAQGSRLFVAVGSLHLVGPAGLPALLRARGFEVDRIDY